MARSFRPVSVYALVSLLVALAGCTPQLYSVLQEQVISLRRGDLEASGIAFITPSTVTGQEQEKQAVALMFADTLKRERPGLRVMTLAETLGAVNRSGLADAYRHMYDDYRDTGLLAREVLRQVGAATGTRYLALLKLQGFGQGSKERFGALGLRIMQTQYADIRLFFQIWDTSDGTVAWEGMQEMRNSLDSVTEEPVMLRTMLEGAAQNLIAKLP